MIKKELDYEKDRERVSDYQADIDALLRSEEKVISSLSDQDLKPMELNMLLVGIRMHEAEAKKLLLRIRSDAEGLAGEYLTTTGIYESTVSGILDRFEKLRQLTEETATGLETADAAGEAAERIRRLNAFAASLK